MARLLDMRKVLVIPVVAGALGFVTRKLGKWVVRLGITVSTAFLQETTLLDTARILTRVPDIGTARTAGQLLKPTILGKHRHNISPRREENNSANFLFKYTIEALEKVDSEVIDNP